MSSAQNHRKRSHRSYDKRVSTMNSLERTTAVRRQTHSFLDMLKQIRQQRRQRKTPQLKHIVKNAEN